MVREYPVSYLNHIKYDYDLYVEIGNNWFIVELDNKYYFGLKNKIFQWEKLGKYYYRLTFTSDYTDRQIKLIAISKKWGNVERPKTNAYTILPELLKYKN